MVQNQICLLCERIFGSKRGDITWTGNKLHKDVRRNLSEACIVREIKTNWIWRVMKIYTGGSLYEICGQEYWRLPESSDTKIWS